MCVKDVCNAQVSSGDMDRYKFQKMELSNFNNDSTQGNKKDLLFLQTDAWLKNTEVRYRIVKSQSRWFLSMLFIAIDNPYRFICRKIDNYETEKKAEMYAILFQRGIRKDARGTLKTDENAFNICHN
jgi:hypothetical protein